MKTIVFALAVSVMGAVFGSSAAIDPEENAQAAAAVEPLSEDEARSRIDAACSHTYGQNHGRCVSCVAKEAKSLRKSGLITVKQEESLTSGYAQTECEPGFEPTDEIVDDGGDDGGGDDGGADDECVLPEPWTEGPDYLVCQCRDGTRLVGCVADGVVDCGSEASIDAACSDACRCYGGAASVTNCAEDSMWCMQPAG